MAVNDMLNPYIAGAPVLETSMFFGRDEVFRWIGHSLTGKYVGHILVIHGQRRVGKTSVLKQIPNFLPETYLQVFLDLQGRTNTTLNQFLWWLAREIVRTLNQKGFDLSRPDRELFTQDEETLIRDFLPSLGPVLGDRHLLLTFDEFDILSQEEIQESLAKPLIDYLRRLLELEGLRFIFSIGSSGNKLEHMQASYTNFFKAALYRKISFLTHRDCQRLITQPVEGVLTYQTEAVERIIQITSGHPYFTQLMCHELFSLCQKTGGREITLAEVSSILGDVIERGTVNLKYVWDEASDLEKWTLACLAGQVGGVSNRQLEALLHEQHVRFSEADLFSAVIHLQDKDVLTEDNQFVVHLMRLWLQRNRPLDRVREELVEVNPIANRFIEIGDEYRELGQGEKAIEFYRQALGVAPDSLKAQLNMAALLHQSGDYPSAAQAYEAAWEMDPEDVVARTSLCEAYLAWGDSVLATGDIESAIGCYQQVLAVNPEHADGRQRLARLYRDLAEARLAEGQDAQALSALSRALDYAPDDDRLATWYDQILEQKGDQAIEAWLEEADRAQVAQQWDQAIKALTEAFRLSHEDSELEKRLKAAEAARRQHLMAAYRAEVQKAHAEGSWEQAVAALENYLELGPETAERTEAEESLRYARKYEGIARLYSQAQEEISEKRYEQATELLQNVISQDPTYQDASQLLLQVVKAQQRTPGYRRPVFYAAAALVAVIVLVGVLFPKITAWISSTTLPGIPIAAQATHTPTHTLTILPTPTFTYTLPASGVTPSSTIEPTGVALTAEAVTATSSILETQQDSSQTATRTATPTQPANLVYKKLLFDQGITSMDWYEPWESVNIGEVIASVAGIDRLKIIYPDTGLVKWDYYQNGRKFISVNHRTAGFDDGLVIFYPRKPDIDSDLAELTALVGKGAIVDLSHQKHHKVIAVSERGHLAEWDYTMLKYQSQVSSGTVHDFDVSMRDEMHVDQILILSEVEGLQIWYLAHSDARTSSYSRKFRLAEYSGSKSADWSPVDNLVAIERGSTMEILRFGWATVEASATLPEKINRVGWSPKGNLIATAGQDGTLRLWSVGGGTSLSSAHTFEQDAEITALAWSPDGDRIVAGDANGYVWVWQVPQELR